MGKLSHLEKLKDLTFPIIWILFTFCFSKLDLCVQGRCVCSGVKSRCCLQTTFSPSLFPTSQFWKGESPQIEKMVGRLWEKLECKSRWVRHQRNGCMGCRTGCTLGTGTSRRRKYHCAEVWNLCCHLPSKDTLESVIKMSSAVTMRRWRQECPPSIF